MCMLSQASTLHHRFMKWSFLVKKKFICSFFKFCFPQERTTRTLWEPELGGRGHFTPSPREGPAEARRQWERLTAKPLLAASAGRPLGTSERRRWGSVQGSVAALCPYPALVWAGKFNEHQFVSKEPYAYTHIHIHTHSPVITTPFYLNLILFFY